MSATGPPNYSDGVRRRANEFAGQEEAEARINEEAHPDPDWPVWLDDHAASLVENLATRASNQLAFLRKAWQLLKGPLLCLLSFITKPIRFVLERFLSRLVDIAISCLMLWVIWTWFRPWAWITAMARALWSELGPGVDAFIPSNPFTVGRYKTSSAKPTQFPSAADLGILSVGHLDSQQMTSDLAAMAFASFTWTWSSIWHWRSLGAYIKSAAALDTQALDLYNHRLSVAQESYELGVLARRSGGEQDDLAVTVLRNLRYHAEMLSIEVGTLLGKLDGLEAAIAGVEHHHTQLMGLVCQDELVQDELAQYKELGRRRELVQDGGKRVNEAQGRESSEAKNQLEALVRDKEEAQDKGARGVVMCTAAKWYHGKIRELQGTLSGRFCADKNGRRPRLGIRRINEALQKCLRKQMTEMTVCLSASARTWWPWQSAHGGEDRCNSAASYLRGDNLVALRRCADTYHSRCLDAAKKGLCGE
ncbi:hypothetical protein GGTG_04952 [Gaeumannomyces tritici R3-111a-1]|uniref:Uncharacterized protein n=1 Tax=Gaeumannomyces tritici (strain R3-111a-1) TaxID=644352 RepID=J3NUJ6_GAET3|nr:hypothetical protein GGTG_04952 [Gaeumannomyces tritici R3-111a-1]EJT79869.1 hypothetical protein GGTG_04952 [Gaeumannomyces tritici R3-111a-1]